MTNVTHAKGMNGQIQFFHRRLALSAGKGHFLGFWQRQKAIRSHFCGSKKAIEKGNLKRKGRRRLKCCKFAFLGWGSGHLHSVA